MVARKLVSPLVYFLQVEALLSAHGRCTAGRAVYSRMQNVLLDEVLSAVDTHTAQTLINKCIFGPIMRGRTVLLVTHHLALVVHGAAWIVKMENGSIKAQGAPNDLRRIGELGTSSRTGADEVEMPRTAIFDMTTEVKVKPDNEKKPSKLVDAETKTT